MKIKCELVVDTETAEYELRFWNLSSPGKAIEYNKVRPLLKKVFEDNEKEIVEGVDSNEHVTKSIH